MFFSEDLLKISSLIFQADGHAKVAPLVALYAGRPELESLVREAVAVTQNNELAIGASVTGKEGAGFHYFRDIPNKFCL